MTTDHDCDAAGERFLLWFFFYLQKYVIQQARVFHGVPWKVQSVERTQGHSRVLLRRLVVSLLHCKKFGQLYIQGTPSEFGGGSGEQTSRAFQDLAAKRGTGRSNAEEAMGKH